MGLRNIIGQWEHDVNLPQGNIYGHPLVISVPSKICTTIIYSNHVGFMGASTLASTAADGVTDNVYYWVNNVANASMICGFLWIGY